MIGRKRRRCGRTFLPQQHTISKKNLKIRKQPKNMCVAHAITAMNELRSGVELDVTDCYTKGMGDSGERLFQVVDKIRNKGQRVFSSKVRLCFDAKPLKRPYVDSIKRALAANKAVVVTIKTYNHESTVQSYYDKDGVKRKQKSRPHAICFYGYHDGVTEKDLHPLEEGYFNFINSHGAWIDGSNGVGLVTYAYAKKHIEEGVISN